MRCPNCNSKTVYARDARQQENNTVKRRRECQKCGARFTTIEKIDEEGAFYIKTGKLQTIFNK